MPGEGREFETLCFSRSINSINLINPPDNFTRPVFLSSTLFHAPCSSYLGIITMARNSLLFGKKERQERRILWPSARDQTWKRDVHLPCESRSTVRVEPDQTVVRAVRTFHSVATDGGGRAEPHPTLCRGDLGVLKGERGAGGVEKGETDGGLARPVQRGWRCLLAAGTQVLFQPPTGTGRRGPHPP